MLWRKVPKISSPAVTKEKKTAKYTVAAAPPPPPDYCSLFILNQPSNKL